MNTNELLIERIQAALEDFEIPAWLFYDFRGLDPIALKILRLDPEKLATRRWFYLVPARGAPRKLTHHIEPDVLAHLPGEDHHYLSWQELEKGVARILAGTKTVAMQHSPGNAIPYVSRVDGGTLELVSSCGTGVVSSGDLIQCFDSVLSAAQLEDHRTSARKLGEIVRAAFQEAACRIRSQGQTTEVWVQQFILEAFGREGLVWDHAPIVAVNAHGANPHYSPGEGNDAPIVEGDFLLIDLFAKSDSEESYFADITWTAVFSATVPERVASLFEVVREGRDRGVEFLQERLGRGQRTEGWEVDDAVREVFRRHGFARQFTHRTGHNLGTELVHGNGVHFDNLETHDTRQVIPGVLCTIEPGIYLPGEIGVRSEINVYIGEQGAEVTTPLQGEVLAFPVS